MISINRNFNKRKENDVCKIMIIPGIPAKTVKTILGKEETLSDRAWHFIQKARPIMCKYDSDGYGYAAMNADSEMFTEKWLTPSDAFKNRYVPDETEASYLDNFMGALKREIGYETSGPIDNFSNITTIMAHARMATCGKTLENTHPFLLNGKALIHNGVIRNLKDHTFVNSSCDSECILTSYEKEGVIEDTSHIQNVADTLSGYYAVSVLGHLSDGNPYVDIFKDKTAQLHAAYVNELECLVFSTTLGILYETAKECGYKIGFTLEVESGELIRLNAITGEVIEVTSFDPTFKIVGFPVNHAEVEDVEITQEDIQNLEDLGSPYYGKYEGYRRTKA